MEVPNTLVFVFLGLLALLFVLLVVLWAVTRLKQKRRAVAEVGVEAV